MEKPIEPKVSIPVSLDWRTKGVINPIYDQGQQPKDATFAAVGQCV
jgi:hypothetical protein